MALPSLPIGSTPLSFNTLLSHFENTGYGDNNLSDYLGAESDSWQDPDDPTVYSTAGSPPGAYLINTITGQSNIWSTFTSDISSYVAANDNVRIAFRYHSGSSYQGDIQVDTVTIPGEATHSFDTGNDSYQYVLANSSPMDYNDSLSWVSVPNNTTFGVWNRDSGGTPSGGTGLTYADSGSYYLYAETSGTAGSNKYFWLRSPTITLATNATSVSYALARYGSNIGTIEVYVIVEGPPPPPAAPPPPPPPGTGRVMLLHQPNGTSYKGDYQITSIEVNKNGVVYHGSDWNTGLEGWSTFGYGSGTANAVAQGFQNGLVESIYSPIVTGTGTGTWNRDTGNTPSSGTGVTFNNNFYIYTETSSYRAVFSAVSPEITLSVGDQYSLSFSNKKYGINIGDLYIYWISDTATSGSMADKILIHTDLRATSYGTTTVYFTPTG